MKFKVQEQEEEPVKKKKKAEKESAIDRVKAKKAHGSKSSKGRNIRETTAASEVQFVLPSENWAEKRLEDEDSDVLVLPVGKSLLVMMPSVEKGRESPWVENRTHYFGGRDILKLLGIEDGSRPDDLPLGLGCLKAHAGEPCDACRLMEQLKRSRSKLAKKVGGKLFASLRCAGQVAKVSLAEGSKAARQADRIYPFKFGWKIASVLLSSLEGGTIFCHPEKLRIISIRRTGTGFNSDYVTTVTKHIFPFRRKAWLPQLDTLDKYKPVLPSRDEMREACDVLSGLLEAGSSDASMDFSKDGPDDDDIPF